MRIGEVVHFSPCFRFTDLDAAYAAGFLEALRDGSAVLPWPCARLLDLGSSSRKRVGVQVISSAPESCDIYTGGKTATPAAHYLIRAGAICPEARPPRR
jgi:hypothetical protein